MRKLAFAVGSAVGLALIAYAVGLGIYAVASARPRVLTQPRSPDEARRVLIRLGLVRDYPFTHRFLLTPHGRMHYVEQGSGPLLLCLHGNGRWSLECGELLRVRSANSRVIAPDLIGFGLSEKPLHPDSDPIESHAADLVGLVAALDLHDVQVVVSKSSAPIAIRLVRLAPERVRSTLIEAAPELGAEIPTSLAVTPLLGELLVQGLGGLSPGWARSRYGRLQGSWSERASSLALARAR